MPDWSCPIPRCAGSSVRRRRSLQDSRRGGLPPASQRMIAIAQLAEYLVQRVTGLSQTREWDKLGTACQKLLGLDDNAVETLVLESPAIVTEVI